MRVSVRFTDGEQLEGDAEHVSLDRGGFTLTGPGGNTRSVWVGSGAIKYVVIHPSRHPEIKRDADPRHGTGLSKVVLHFLDGEVLHSYQDKAFGEEPGGFVARLWDAERRELVKALVSGSSLKGVFFVDEWDSRTEDEKRTRASPDEATTAWYDQPFAAAAPPPTVIATPAPEPPIVADVVAQATTLQGPMLVEQPELLPDTVVQETVQETVVVEQPVPLDGPDRLDQPDHLDEPVLLDEPVSVVDPSLLSAPMVGANPVVALIVGDNEERRAGFRSALTPRRSVTANVPGPEELRYRLLRARISEVLGHPGPAEHDDDSDGEES
ncbi:MAG: hypothetical protein ACR2MY_15015 [Candidatus Dormibacteria bacterium]